MGTAFSDTYAPFGLEPTSLDIAFPKMETTPRRSASPHIAFPTGN